MSDIEKLIMDYKNGIEDKNEMLRWLEQAKEGIDLRNTILAISNSKEYITLEDRKFVVFETV